MDEITCLDAPDCLKWSDVALRLEPFHWRWLVLMPPRLDPSAPTVSSFAPTKKERERQAYTNSQRLLTPAYNFHSKSEGRFFSAAEDSRVSRREASLLQLLFISDLFSACDVSISTFFSAFMSLIPCTIIFSSTISHFL